eukprot:scaffold28952_cov58-Attheya_sp.AAC.6
MRKRPSSRGAMMSRTATLFLVGCIGYSVVTTVLNVSINVPPLSHSLINSEPMTEKGVQSFRSQSKASELKHHNATHEPNAAEEGNRVASSHKCIPNSTTQYDLTKSFVEPTKLGALVILAPRRSEDSLWSVDRFCMLRRAVRSFDSFINAKYGPYPIYILVTKDYEEDPEGIDAAYTDEDRAILRRWAPRSNITFVEINLYSEDALEPETTPELVGKWVDGFEKSVSGRNLGYRSMCRLFSGRLQMMDFLKPYKYYMRIDDDSLITRTPIMDPFQHMEREGLQYLYRQSKSDRWGIDHLARISEPYLRPDHRVFWHSEKYTGSQPYNNFHITSLAFWNSVPWQCLWNELNREHAFLKYRVGDANVHAMAVMMMEPKAVVMSPTFPYVHNSNNFRGWGPQLWQDQCDEDNATQSAVDVKSSEWDPLKVTR